MLAANRLDCPRCLDTRAVRHFVRPRPPSYPTGRLRTFRGRVQAEMRCDGCGHRWWSRHEQALVMAEALLGRPIPALLP
jgi:hypothetical protein